ncbi:glycosyltransferase [Clostridium sp. JS66]|uniref:tetratricopeptide repeat-containing glycosyltransferase family 2 protein n=1 Tax=Clostridium sp. JS66 TaxID=3064705 RepID=UPI00298DD283|nr:glycosyltransferase [Clostridium sp. JS66]WPC41073.1 glycosyltransferase [Clostridium sp. JS66]
MKISACIIAKDEERYIEKCLKSLYYLVEKEFGEIIFVDTGSKDKTVKIARNYTDNIFFYQWNNDFAAARNFSITKAKGEYVLIIDADEEIEENSLKKIVEVFNGDYYKKFNTFTFKEKNFSDESLKNFGVFTRRFIFKNSKDFFYTGKIHEQPSIMEPHMDLDVTVLHYGYIMDEETKEKKFKRNSEILEMELQDHPENLYYRYQLSVTYEMHGELEKALEQIKIVVSTINNLKYNKLFLLYYNTAARIYKSLKLYDEAIELCNKGLKHQEDFIDLIYCLAEIFYTEKNYEKALQYSNEYIKLLNELEKHQIFHDTRFLFYSLDCKKKIQSITAVSSYKLKKKDILYMIENCEFETVDKTTAQYIIDDLVYFVENINLNEINISNIYILKKAIEFIFQRTLNSNQIECLDTSKYLEIIDKYLCLGNFMLERNLSLVKEEKSFFIEMKKVFDALQKFDLLTMVKLIKTAVELNNNMARPMEIYLKKILEVMGK